MALSWGNTATTASTIQSVEHVKRVYASDVDQFVTPASVAINVGDLLLWDTTAHCVRLMSNAAWDTNAATTQADVAPVFLGIAAGAKDAADARSGIDIPVYTRGKAVYPAVAVNTIYDPGQFVCAAAQGTNNLSDFTVIRTATQANAIGYMRALAAANAVVYAFYFQSPLLYGALNQQTPG